MNLAQILAMQRMVQQPQGGLAGMLNRPNDMMTVGPNGQRMPYTFTGGKIPFGNAGGYPLPSFPSMTGGGYPTPMYPGMNAGGDPGPVQSPYEGLTNAGGFPVPKGFNQL